MAAYPRHVVIVVADCCRYDVVPALARSPYMAKDGLPRPLDLPSLGRLCAEGTVVANAVTAVPITPAAHTSLLSGLYSPRHGVREFFRHAVHPSVQLLPERLSAAGFKTAAFSDFPELLAGTGLLGGFDRIGNDMAAVGNCLDEWSGERVFLYVHMRDLHAPYGPNDGDIASRMVRHHANQPAPYADQIKEYLAAVERFDQERLAPLLATLDRKQILDDALLVFASDHGEGRLPDGQFGHAKELSEEVIRVPIILRGGGFGSDRLLGGQASIVDIAPTVLRAVGAEEMQDIDGIALQDGPDDERWVYAEVFAAKGESPVRRKPELLNRTAERLAAARSRPAILAQRCLRNTQTKVVLRGEHLPNFLDTTTDLSPEAFCRAVYRRWVGRFEDPTGYANWVRYLTSRNPQSRARRQMIKRIAASPEMVRQPKYATYRIARDPLEASPESWLPRQGASGPWKSWLEILERVAASALEAPRAVVSRGSMAKMRGAG